MTADLFQLLGSSQSLPASKRNSRQWFEELEQVTVIAIVGLVPWGGSLFGEAAVSGLSLGKEG